MTTFLSALAAAFFWGLSSFVEKWGLRGTDAMAGVVARSAGVFLGTVLFVAALPSAGRGFADMGWAARLPIMAGGILASVLGQIFFYRALKDGEVGRVSAVGGSWPLIAFLLSL